jgi:hypothetical protein
MFSRGPGAAPTPSPAGKKRPTVGGTSLRREIIDIEIEVSKRPIGRRVPRLVLGAP